MRVGCRTGCRLSIYVPEDFVPEIQRCLGRALPKLPFAAPRYVQALTRASKHDLTDVESDVLGQKLVLSELRARRA